MSQNQMNVIAKLKELRNYGGAARTTGLDDATIERFAASRGELREAIDAAYEAFQTIKGGEFEDLLRADEATQIQRTQAGFINFYPEDGVNPYVALAARGPWVITLKGAVVHDNGGYGMLGAGHTPAAVLEAMSRPQVMANVMTPNLAQLRLERVLRREIGQTRGGCPYSHFLCLNSGSESVTLAARFVDINARLMTDPGARHAGRSIKRVAVKGAFHGRTERPALYSDSTRRTYLQHLASFRGEDSLITIAPYDIEQLRQTFAEAEAEGWFIEAVFLEPVMGEGDPGRAMPPAFYAAARELTQAHGALLLVDSIQAGLRAHGVLSVIDYPGFEGLPAPDMESYSKALNAGQYPLSVLAVTERAAALYRKGVYGNTMTTNPRAMDVAVAVLEGLSPAIRANIRRQGRAFLDKLEALKSELGGLITKVQGTGLLFSCELSPDFKCFGEGSTEEYMREHGIGVIHGGANSLRFTPHFAIADDEVDLVVGKIREALVAGPRKARAEAA